MASPFKSKAQIERCRRLVSEGKMSEAAFEESLALSGDIEALPERLHPKPEVKPAPTDSGPKDEQ